MILVLERIGGLLHLYSSIREVETHIEAIDIENNEYDFCDDTGQQYVGEFTTPITFFRAGSFCLKPRGAPDQTILASFLSRTRSLERECNGVRTLDELRKRLGI